MIRFDPPAEPTATGNVRVWTGEAVNAYAAGRRDEREKIRQQFLGVITANVSEGLDTVYGALLDAIRELGQ